MELKVDGSAVTQPISGSVSISGTPSVSITGTPVLGVGSSTIGKADILGNSGASLDSAAGTTNSQALTIQGNASGIPVPVVGTFSATLGGFIPTPAYSVENVIPTSSTYALPTGAVIIFYNTGSTAITVKLGASGVSVTAGQADVIQPNSWMAFTVGTATYYAVIGNGGTSTVVASGGSGLPTGAGGGGGGGSVGAVGTPDITGYSNGGTATTDTGDSYGRYMEIKAGSNAAQLLGGNAHIVGATGATLDSAAGTANGQALTIQGNAGGVAVPMSLASLPALAAGSATIGKADVLGNSGATLDSAVGTTNAQALTTQGGGPTAVVAPVILPPQTTGGWGGTVVANLTTPVVVKASAGTVGRDSLRNHVERVERLRSNPQRRLISCARDERHRVCPTRGGNDWRQDIRAARARRIGRHLDRSRNDRQRIDRRRDGRQLRSGLRMSARRIAGSAALALGLALSPASAGDGLMLLGVTNGGVNAFASACASASGILASSKLCIFDAATTASTATFNPSAIPGTITIALYGQGGNGQPAASATLGGQAGIAGSFGSVTGLTHSGAYTITRTRRHEHRRRRNLPDGLHDQRRQRRDGRSSRNIHGYGWSWDRSEEHSRL